MEKFRKGEQVRVLDGRSGSEIARGEVQGYTAYDELVQVKCRVAGQEVVANYPFGRVEAVDDAL